MGNYQELIFYQKSRQVVKRADTLIKSWPKTMQAQEISRQLFSSAISVGANIPEGYGRHHGTEYIHHLIIAQGSANETEHWLHTAQDCELGSNAKIGDALKINQEVILMIASTISTIRAGQGTKSVREDDASYTAATSSITND